MADPDAVRVQEALGQSDAFLAFQERLGKVAAIDRPVLLVGERGTGKELAATRLHFLSKRWDAPLVALNCAALAPTLIESELFGYEEGAFTGARGRRTGRFESAEGGTLFLDEVGIIPMEVQEKILRVVEYGTFERVGSSTATQADVRIIGATNVDLPALTAQGRFKQDLLDRLSFEVLFLPPLRERAEDVPLLANHFAARMSLELGQESVPEFSEEASAALEAYRWPGNVRELKNAVERAVYHAGAGVISEADIVFDPFRYPFGDGLASREVAAQEPGPGPEPVPAPATDVDLGTALPEAIKELEIRYLKAALAKARHNQNAAAEILGLTYHQFRGLYRKHKDSL